MDQFISPEYQDWLRQVQSHPLLAPNQTVDLIIQYRQEDNRHAFDRAVNGNLRLVHTVASGFLGFVNSGWDQIDTAMTGVFGLIWAVEKFDPFRGCRFSTPAANEIRGAITHALRDIFPLIRPSREQPIYFQFEPLETDDILDHSCPSPEEAFFANPPTEMIWRLVNRLPKDQSRVINLLYTNGGMSQREVGNIIGLSQMQVSRIHRQALKNLRAKPTAPKT